LCQGFPLGEVSSANSGVFLTRVRKSGVFLLLSSRLILSILYFFPFRSAWVCIVCVLPRCFQPSNNPSTTLCFCCVKFVICAVNFLYFRARSFGVILVFFGGSRSELTLWNTGAEFLPFLQGCFFPLEDTAARNFFLTATTQFVFNFCVDF
jgi:hypothetical protein